MVAVDMSRDSILRNRVLATSEFVVDVLEDCWDYEDCFRRDDRVAWQRWIYDVFARSPITCETYADDPTWWPTLQRLFGECGLPPKVQAAMDELSDDAAATASQER